MDKTEYVIVDKEKLAALLAYADIKGHVRGVEYTVGRHEDICKEIAAPYHNLAIIDKDELEALRAAVKLAESALNYLESNLEGSYPCGIDLRSKEITEASEAIDAALDMIKEQL